MFKKLFTLCLAALLISSISFAAIRRVGYNGIARSGVDYADFASAHTASAVGDTIQIYGSVTGTVTKRLVILGFGYNFDVNPNLQAIGGESPSVGGIIFSPGSDSSIIEGVDGNFQIGNQSNTPVGVGVSKVIIRRCRGTITLYNFYAPVNDVKITSCIATSINMSHNAAPAFPCTNLQVSNCYIGAMTMYQAGSSGSVVNCVTPSPTISGVGLTLNNAGFLVKNSILSSYNSANINTVYENDFFGVAQPSPLPPGSNNRWGQIWANLFTRQTPADDRASFHAFAEFDEDYFVLKPGSLAINGGFDSGGNPTDAGFYGGDALYRYKLSGVPAVPAIYKLTAPTTAATSNPYNVTISVRSNN